MTSELEKWAEEQSQDFDTDRLVDFDWSTRCDMVRDWKARPEIKGLMEAGAKWLLEKLENYDRVDELLEYARELCGVTDAK